MTVSPTIDVLGPGELEAIEDLARKDGGNLIYATPHFLAFLARATEASVEVLAARCGGALVGALPYAVLTREAGSVVNSLPWWGSHGSVVLDRADPAADAIRRALLRSFSARMADLDPLSFTIILLPDEEPSRTLYEAILAPTVIDGRIGQVTALPPQGPDLEARLLATCSQKTRNLVRKSLKQGFTEVVTDDAWAWEFLHRTHVANITALGGRPKPWTHFAALRATLPPAMRRLSVAMDGDTPAAAMLLLSFNGTVEYVTPAIEVTQRPRQPLSFLIHQAMLAAVRDGATQWNWGGTWVNQHDLHHFKAGFGAVDKPYSYLVRASERGLAAFRRHRDALLELFPYFYTYPFGALDDPA